jgi:23S rRNA pseudouridine2604 synthase
MNQKTGKNSKPAVIPDNPEEESAGTRLNKFISETGICSRREADKLIVQGKVLLNGRVAVLGDKAVQTDEVVVDGKPLAVKKKAVYLAFHKPVGITCTTERHVKGNIVDYINYKERIFPIGRLDKPSEGLIFLTNDGDIVNKILRAGNNHEKEYVVTVDKPITPDFIRKMANGVPIFDTVTKKCFVRQESRYVFTIILTQGLNRQIRRMCDYLGFQVTRLKRIRIMTVTLHDLGVGKWRHLTALEMETINKLVLSSSKTEEASRLEETDFVD